MANVVLGLAASHGPMISTPPEQWDARVPADKSARHPFRGKTYGFDELVQARAKENLGEQIRPDRWRDRHAACQSALKVLADAFKAARVDVAIIVGDDQNEMFPAVNSPPFFVFTGETVIDEPATPEQLAMMPPGVAIADGGHRPTRRETYPCHPGLARELAARLRERGFDIHQASEWTHKGAPWSAAGMPHAYGFIYKQIMRGEVTSHVPFFINTFFPPTQPSAARCVELGDHIAAIVAAWPTQARVAIIGSGGLSHFVIYEDLDRKALDLMARADRRGMAALPEELLQSGNSEIKNWLPVTTACDAVGLKMRLVDYQPCYRSLAGTGTANAFAIWQ